jgi:hypothetical protein
MDKIIYTLLIFCASVSMANAPKVGKNAAAKYFQANSQAKGSAEDYPKTDQERSPSSIDSLGDQEHYLAFGVGSFTQTDSYNWGQSSKEEDVGKFGIDMTYRLAQEGYLFDQALRVSYNEFKAAGERATKLSFMYAMTLPDAGSKFPLYFGLAAGPGVFLKQLSGESALSLDYQLFLGLRLFNLFEKTGFYVEGGMRNHLHLTTDGQLNGTFISAGAVFTF